MNPSLHGQGLTRAYADGAAPALDAADFTFNRGEFVAIRGPSGGGKSTLLNLIGLLDRPTSGRLWMDGDAVEDLDDRALGDLRRRHVGFLFQDAGLVDRMSAADNVRLPLDYRRIGEGERRARVDAAIERLGLSHRRNALVDTLSGGERQRVGLARLLALRPDIIICDEPTASLDEDNSQVVIQHLRHAADGGACVVCASHDALVLAAADRRFSLARGRLVAETAA